MAQRLNGKTSCHIDYGLYAFAPLRSCALKSHVPSLSGRNLNPFIIKRIQNKDNFFPCDCRINYFVNISAFVGNKWVRDFIAIFFNKLLFKFNWVLRLCKFFSVEDSNGPIRTHHCDFGRWPCKTEITSKVFTVHNNKSSSICFPQYYCYFRNSSFAICEKQFGTMSDNTRMCLIDTRKESGNIFECDYRYIKSITKSYKSRTLC